MARFARHGYTMTICAIGSPKENLLGSGGHPPAASPSRLNSKKGWKHGKHSQKKICFVSPKFRRFYIKIGLDPFFEK